MSMIKYLIYTGSVAIYPYLKPTLLLFIAFIVTLYVFNIFVADELYKVQKKEHKEYVRQMAELAAKLEKSKENPEASNA